jgi:hypothetical protein
MTEKKLDVGRSGTKARPLQEGMTNLTLKTHIASQNIYRCSDNDFPTLCFNRNNGSLADCMANHNLAILQ